MGEILEKIFAFSKSRRKFLAFLFVIGFVYWFFVYWFFICFAYWFFGADSLHYVLF